MSSRLLALLAAFVLAFAQGGAQAQPAHLFSQQELDQMLAPIALYPDPLLSQILMASTYPLEVVEAARWSKARPGLSGDDAVRAAEGEDWDPSVKSLVAFPQVLERMDENLQWTQSLGDAFLDQESQVMDTVQTLRRKAYASGNLRSDDRVSVVESGPSLLVQPYDPQLVYVPYYDPTIVYGSWWWPAYPPVYWRPWPDYYARPAYAGGFYWGSPIGISAGFFFGAFDWHRRHVRVVHVDNYYYRHGVGRNREVIANRVPGAWRHEPQHRRGIAYRGVDAQQRFGAANASQGRGNRSRQAESRRADVRTDVRPAAPAGIRPEARFEGRQRDARPAAETRANVQPAPAVQPAPVTQPAPADRRFDRRGDSRPDDRRDRRSDDRRDTRGDARSALPAPVVQPAPLAQPAPATQPAPADRRFDRRGDSRPDDRRDRRSDDRRDTRGAARSALPAPIAQPTPPAPVVQSAPVTRPAQVVQPAPAAQPAPAVRSGPAERRSDHRRDSRSDDRRDTRGAAQPAPLAPIVQSAPLLRPAQVAQPAPTAPIVQRAPVMQRAPAVNPAPVAQPAPASSGNRPAARAEGRARHEARPAGEGARRQDAGADSPERTRSGR